MKGRSLLAAVVVGLIVSACGIPTTDEVIALDDSAEVRAGESVEIHVLANDLILAGDGEVSILEAPTGSVAVRPGGVVVYSAAPGTSADDSFTYVVTSGDRRDVARVFVDVIGAGAFLVEPSEVRFEEVPVGGRDVRELVVTNTGERDAAVVRFDLEGGPGFSIAGDTCDDPIAPGGACRVEVAFSPENEGDHEALLSVVADDGTVGVARLIGGAAGTARLSASTGALDFEFVPFGEERVEAVTFVNEGDGAVGVGVAPPEPPFEIVANGCATELGPGATCEVEVAFRPPPLEPGEAPAVEPVSFEGALVLDAADGAALEVWLMGRSGSLLPDLVASASEVGVTDDLLGETLRDGRVTEIEVEIVVANVGDAPTVRTFMAVVSLTGQPEPYVFEFPIEATLAPGEQLQMPFSFPVPEDRDAPYVLEVVVDPCEDDSGCEIVERDESNNTSGGLDLNPVVGRSDVELVTHPEVLTNLESNFGDLVADAVLYAALRRAEEAGLGRVDVAFVPAFVMDWTEDEIPAGELRKFRLWMSVAPVEGLVLEPVSLEELELMVEIALSEFGSERFLQISGFRYDWCVDRDPFDRVPWLQDPFGPPLEGAEYVSATAGGFDDFFTEVFLEFGFELPESQGIGARLPEILIDYVGEALGGEVTGDAYPPGSDARIADVLCE